MKINVPKNLELFYFLYTISCLIPCVLFGISTNYMTQYFVSEICIVDKDFYNQIQLLTSLLNLIALWYVSKPERLPNVRKYAVPVTFVLMVNSIVILCFAVEYVKIRFICVLLENLLLNTFVWSLLGYYVNLLFVDPDERVAISNKASFYHQCGLITGMSIASYLRFDLDPNTIQNLVAIHIVGDYIDLVFVWALVLVAKKLVHDDFVKE